MPGLHCCRAPCRLPPGGAMPTELVGGEPIKFDEPAYELRWVNCGAPKKQMNPC